MFYSHEILTSREGGVATVWLVATLGSKSKKVNRKAILDVNVRKTCEIIITPEAPMALRLQSNLLYGVSRVYSQQCEYTLSDAQLAQSNMRALLKAVRTANLDPNAGKARPDQLVLQDDPAFIPDFLLPSLDIDLSALDISNDTSLCRSSILSPRSQLLNISSGENEDSSKLGLIIPTSDTGGVGDLGGFVLPEDDRYSLHRGLDTGGLLRDEDEGFNLDPGFTVDADGNLLLTGSQEAPRQQNTLEAGRGTIMGRDSGISVRVRQELKEGAQGGDIQLRGVGQSDLGLITQRTNDEDILLPDAEAFPETVPGLPAGGAFRASSPLMQEDPSLEVTNVPIRRKRRAPKELTRDNTTELRNADLTRWNNNYIANMVDESRAKLQHRAPAFSKKNATFWVYGSGIGGIGSRTAGDNFDNPLSMFAGEALMEALTGVASIPVGGKRAHEDSNRRSESEGRRVRMREDYGEYITRGDQMALNDDETLAILAGEDIEIGREAPPALEDQSFPWNVSVSAGGSRTGSAARGYGLQSSAGGFPTSAGRPSSFSAATGGAPGSHDRRTSRVTSASPLFGRGLGRYSSLELPLHEESDDLLAGRDISGFHETSDFQLYGPAAGVDTQDAAQSQWTRAALNQESNNFLDFVKSQIGSTAGPIGEEGQEFILRDTSQKSILFEELLPTSRHTKIVAAQGLLHVLALATKGLLNVQQDSAYGPVTISLQAGS